ncbi:hypothetical protein [Oricola sp.]|uniref:hypothetical protein n=1 Tax=Oricola sp. TaxID=1979950 RepID=UPI003BAAFD82
MLLTNALIYLGQATVHWPLTQQQLRRRLLGERPSTTPLELDFADLADGIRADRASWVKMLVDEKNQVQCGDGLLTAYRSITMDGALVWYVFAKDKPHGYHSLAEHPDEAFREARAAMAARKRALSQWETVQGFGELLRSGQVSFTFTSADLKGTPLCDLGIQNFLRTFRLHRVQRISGRWVGWLMLIEPQVGFVVYASLVRRGFL